MFDPLVAEHRLIVRFYDQPPEKIEECFDALCLIASGLVTYATRPLQSTLHENGIPERYVGATNTECMLIFDSASSLAAFEADPRAKEIYSWFASAGIGGNVITDATHVLRHVPE